MTTEPGNTPPSGQDEADLVSLQPGQAVGRYEILAILGQGGFGITYRARDTQLGRDVAIKEYLPTAFAVRSGGVTVVPRSTKVAEDFTWGRQRFVDEGRTLATLQRARGIVRVFDFLEANGTAYIVMELAPGRTMESRLATGTLSAAEIELILWPLLDGLQQVHATGFLHRDIKPANILLDQAGNPTLIDFGASRVPKEGATSAMTAIFTPGFAAAEQFTSARQGPWTDIYGVAATLYNAITGTAPPSAFDRMLGDTYKPLSELKPEGFSSALLAGIDNGLAVRSTARPQSIADWRAILRGEAAPVVAAPSPAPADQPITAAPPPPTKPRRMALWVAAAAVLILGGAGYYFGVARPAAFAEAERLTKLEARRAEEKIKREKQEAEAKVAAEEAKAKAAIEEKLRARQREEELRKAEEEARKKAEDEFAERQRAEEEAKKKAEAADPKVAEAAENALHLGILDHQHIQVALTALGHDTKRNDGVMDAHTRDMIGAWQKEHGDLPTRFLTGLQNQALLNRASPAISKFDADQKKPDQAAKRLDAAPTPGAPYDGTYSGVATFPTGASIPLSLHIVNGIGSGSWLVGRCGTTLTFTVSIDPAGNARMAMNGWNQQCQANPMNLAGRAQNNQIEFSFPYGGQQARVDLTRQH